MSFERKAYPDHGHAHEHGKLRNPGGQKGRHIHQVCPLGGYEPVAGNDKCRGYRHGDGGLEDEQYCFKRFFFDEIAGGHFQMGAFARGKRSANEGDPERPVAHVFGCAGQRRVEKFAQERLYHGQRNHDRQDGNGRDIFKSAPGKFAKI
ncbi:MAG: hypothetical protein NTX06_07985, partial [Proteobacteria bacterium]|nr:hypothetical protein [Pseudomonadota bacterium]